MYNKYNSPGYNQPIYNQPMPNNYYRAPLISNKDKEYNEKYNEK